METQLIEEICEGAKIPFSKKYTLQDLKPYLLEYIHKLKRANYLYETIVNNNLVGIWQYGLKGNITFCNPAFAHMYGFKSPEEMIGMNTLDLVAEEHREMVREKQKKRLSAEVESENYEVLLKRKDGTVFPALLYASAVKNAEGKIREVVGVIVDISDLKRIQKSLNKEKEKLGKFVKVAVRRENRIKELKDKLKELQEKIKFLEEKK